MYEKKERRRDSFSAVFAYACERRIAKFIIAMHENRVLVEDGSKIEMYTSIKHFSTSSLFHERAPIAVSVD
jgi:hypothetical protein